MILDGIGETLVDIAELDVIYLSYDEKHKEEFWAKILAMVPWAKRVDGVAGSDAAHKEVARISETERFILIDGDNIPNPVFFDQQLVLNNLNNKCVFRWKATNVINGLTYGNGGLSCWTKEFVNNMHTHEASFEDDHTAVEFCWNDGYLAMNDVWSTTYPNQSPMQAWRAGFREGVKMCLDRGKKPSLLDFTDSVCKGNLRNLSIWHNIGTDVEYGNWAILGARQGTVFTMLEDWDFKNVQDFSLLNEIFNKQHDVDVDELIIKYGEQISRQLGLPILSCDKDYSKFFKDHAFVRKNLGIMVREGMNG